MELWIRKNMNKLIFTFGIIVLINLAIITVTTPKALRGGCFRRYQDMLSLAAEVRQDSSLVVERLDVYNDTVGELSLRIGNIEKFINQNY